MSALNQVPSNMIYEFEDQQGSVEVATISHLIKLRLLSEQYSPESWRLNLVLYDQSTKTIILGLDEKLLFLDSSLIPVDGKDIPSASWFLEWSTDIFLSAHSTINSLLCHDRLVIVCQESGHVSICHIDDVLLAAGGRKKPRWIWETIVPESAWGCAVDAKSMLMAVSSNDHCIRIFDLRQSSQHPLHLIKAHAHNIPCLAFLPKNAENGTITCDCSSVELISGSIDKTVSWHLLSFDGCNSSESGISSHSVDHLLTFPDWVWDMCWIAHDSNLLRNHQSTNSPAMVPLSRFFSINEPAFSPIRQGNTRESESEISELNLSQNIPVMLLTRELLRQQQDSEDFSEELLGNNERMSSSSQLEDIEGVNEQLLTFITPANQVEQESARLNDDLAEHNLNNFSHAHLDEELLEQENSERYNEHHFNLNVVQMNSSDDLENESSWSMNAVDTLTTPIKVSTRVSQLLAVLTGRDLYIYGLDETEWPKPKLLYKKPKILTGEFKVEEGAGSNMIRRWSLFNNPLLNWSMDRFFCMQWIEEIRSMLLFNQMGFLVILHFGTDGRIGELLLPKPEEHVSPITGFFVRRQDYMHVDSSGDKRIDVTVEMRSWIGQLWIWHLDGSFSIYQLTRNLSK